jgi:hypothetical protein
VIIRLENKKTFEINKQKSSSDFQYIQSFNVNGLQLNSSAISHSTIINGGKLEFVMQEKQDEKSDFGNSVQQRPVTEILFKQIIQIPIINAPGRLTNSSKTITIEHPDSKVNLFYTLDGTEPTQKSFLYNNPFTCDSSLTIKVKAYLKNESSSIATAHIYKKPNNWTIQILSQYNKQYDADGDDGIIDGQHGTRNWKSGGWQGYQGQDFNCIVDLGKITPIHYVNASFLQDTRSWIIYPKQVEYYISEDGINYKSFGIIENGVAADDYSIQMRTFLNNNFSEINARYIKIKAINFGKLPEWHQGNGDNAFIFIDEIEIK